MKHMRMLVEYRLIHFGHIAFSTQLKTKLWVLNADG